MASLADIRSGIQTRLDTISGLRAYEYVGDTLNTPCAMVRPQDVSYDSTFDGTADWTLIVDVYVSAADMRAAQKNMDGYWDPGQSGSVHQAIDGDTTLGGLVDSARVTTATGYAVISVADQPNVRYLTAAFTVEVI